MVATPEELARLIGARQVPSTSLYSFGQLPTQRPQAAPSGKPPAHLMAAAQDAAAMRGSVGLNQKEFGDLSLWEQVKAGTGMVLGSTPAQVILKPLDLLQTGQRAILTGIEHAARALPDSVQQAFQATGFEHLNGPIGLLNMVNEDKSRQDERSVVDRLAGKGGYGFGQVAKSTGTKWGDRAVGFTGDVATDPLSYMGGVGDAMGKVGRAGAASRASMLNFSDDAVRTVLRAGVTKEDLVTRAAKGAAWLDDAERELLGLAKSGLRFGGRDGVLIPGTGRLARGVGQGTGTIRRGITGSRPWQAIASNPEHLQDAMRVLATAKPSATLSVAQAGAVVAADETFRMGRSSFFEPLAKRLGDAGAQTDDLGRRAGTVGVETGDLSHPFAKQLSEIQDEAYRMAHEAGVKLPYRKNHMTHVWTEEAQRWFSNADVVDPKGVKVNLLAESGATLERKFGPGVYKINGKPVDFGGGTIGEIENALKKAFDTAPVPKWLEDDGLKLALRNLHQLADDVGKVTMVNRLLASGDMAKHLDLVSDEVLDRAAKVTANADLEKVLKAEQVARKADLDDFTTVATGHAKAVQAALADVVRSELRNLDGVSGRLGAQWDALVAEGKSMTEVADGIRKTMKAERKSAMGRIEKLSAEIKAIDDKLLAANAAAADATGLAGERSAWLAERIALVEQKTALEVKILRAEETAASLAEHVESIRALEATLGDPDAMHRLAQSLVKTKEVELEARQLVEVAATPEMTVKSNYWKGRAAEAWAAADEAAARGREAEWTAIAKSAEEARAAVVAARKEFKDATDAFVRALDDVNVARSKRVGSMPLPGWDGPAPRPVPTKARQPSPALRRQVGELEKQVEESTRKRALLERLSREAEENGEDLELGKVNAKLVEERATLRDLKAKLDVARQRLADDAVGTPKPEVNPPTVTTRMTVDKVAIGAGRGFENRTRGLFPGMQRDIRLAVGEYVDSLPDVATAATKAAADRKLYNASKQILRSTIRREAELTSEVAARRVRIRAAERVIADPAVEVERVIVNGKTMSGPKSTKIAAKKTAAVHLRRSASRELRDLLDEAGRVNDELVAATKEADSALAKLGPNDAAYAAALKRSEDLRERLQNVNARWANRYSEVESLLPDAERAYLEALGVMQEASKVLALREATSRAAEAAAEKAQRVGTDISAAYDKVALARELERVAAQNTFSVFREKTWTVTEVVPERVLKLRAEIDAELKAMPEVKPAAKLKGEASKAARTRSVKSYADITDDQLKLLPDDVREKFISMRGEVNGSRESLWGQKTSNLQQELDAVNAQLKQMDKDLRPIKTGLFMEGEQGGANAAFEAGIDLQQRSADRLALLEKRDDLIWAIEETRVADDLVARSAWKVQRDKLDAIADFIDRYSRAVEKGAPPGDETAAAIAAVVAKSKREALTKRIQRWNAKYAAGGKVELPEEAVREQFEDIVNTRVAEIQHMRDYRKQLLNQQRKMDDFLGSRHVAPTEQGKPIEDWMAATDGIGDETSDLSMSIASAAEQRALLGQKIRELDQMLSNEKQMFAAEVASYTGAWRSNARLGRRAQAELIDRAAQEQRLLGRSLKANEQVALLRQSEPPKGLAARLRNKAKTAVGEEKARLLERADAAEANWRQWSIAHAEAIATARAAGGEASATAAAENVDVIARTIEGGWKDRSYEDGLLDMLMPRGSADTVKGQAKIAADIAERVKPTLDGLFRNLSPEFRQRLTTQAEETLSRMMRDEVDWGVKHRMLGAGGEVRVDWRAAVLDDAVVPLAPQREELLLQRKLYKQAAAPLRKELSATGKVVDAERRAVAEGWQAESQLDEVNAKLDELGLSEPTVTRAQQAAQEQVADLSKSREQVARELYDEVQQLRNADGLARERFDDVSESAEALQMGAWLNAGARARVDAEVEGLKAVAKKLAKEPKRSNLSAVADELGDIAKALPDSPELNAALALHAQFTRSLVKVAHAQDNVDWVKVVRDAAKKGDAVDVMMKQAKDGWEEVARAILPESQRVALQKPIADAFKNVEYGFKFDGGLKMVEDLTKFFKTYATATPGFHVRNAMSATFMNYSDGVSTKAMREGMQLWKQYTKDPTTFMAAIETNPRVREAFRAVFGSGAGGQFSAEELATELSTKLLHNKWTKLSKRMGGAVEGTVRLGMALDSMDRGMDAFAAMSRITRIHFDYSQLSKLDRYIKLAVPFWTFMSRNLPLQIQQMWTKPRVYSMYNHFQANLGGGNEFEGMPSWMQDKEAVPLGTMPSGSELAFMPDLPHLNAGEQLGLLASGDPRKMMSAMNPMITAPMEALSGERFRFGTKFENNGDRVEHLFTQMLPPFAHTQRLLGLGRYEGQIPEKVMNFAGIPLQVVGQKERQAVLDRQG